MPLTPLEPPLERAKHLLLNTELARAAVPAGRLFGPGAILGLFKQETLVTPTAFRRLFQPEAAGLDANSENYAAVADSHRGSFI